MSGSWVSRDARPWFGSNLKMALSRAETRELVAAAAVRSAGGMGQLFLVPSAPFLAESAERARGTGLRIGAQGCSTHARGAFTGEVSAEMIRDAGADFVMVGHAERHRLGESAGYAALSAAQANAAGLPVLYCIGDESRGDPEDAAEFAEQVRTYGDASDLAGGIVAYEPHWAIGEAGTRPEVAYVATRLALLRELLDASGCHSAPLLYGGSVDAGNAAELSEVAESDGLFVGRSAWSPEKLEIMLGLVRQEDDR